MESQFYENPLILCAKLRPRLSGMFELFFLKILKDGLEDEFLEKKRVAKAGIWRQIFFKKHPSSNIHHPVKNL